jgi:glutathione synthase/RimK-type ligase-like ATP-grasp enzyme
MARGCWRASEPPQGGRPIAAVTGLAESVDDGLPAYIGFAGLWRLELSGMAADRLGPLLEARLARDPGNAAAMMDIATLSILTLRPENREIAFAMQSRALDLQQVFRLPAAREPAGVRMLTIVSTGDMTAVTPLDCLVENSDVELQMLYVRPGRPLPAELPDHDLVFVAVGESGPNRPVLDQLGQFVKSSPKPVLNLPERILKLARNSVSEALRRIPGVVMPVTTRVGRQSLARVGRSEAPLAGVLDEGAFPIIARPIDSQGGKDLARLDAPAAVIAYLDATPSEDFFISRFIDYSGADGFFRKYRVVVIDGRPFACHMGVSRHWMIHYVNADMDLDAGKREEEARFMAGFDAGFAARHGRALRGIDAAMGLDYYAIDCAETADGGLLVFEVDTAMLVHAMDAVDLYPYKQPQMRKVFAAFREMLEKRKIAAPK